MEDSKPKKELKCLVCEGSEFETQEGRIDGMYGVTSHKVTLKICSKCGYTHLFSQGHSWFDFD